MAISFKPFEQMTPEDYAGIGLKVGLEVHQQLLTRRKLFCRCPAGKYTSAFDAEILRHMRPTLSELGEYDGTALMEKKTRKNIYYRINHATVCTYEFDDTPPFFIDDEALDIAIEMCLLLRLNVVSEFHIARKQYLDGSIPTGFQRTGIVGVTGWIPFKERRIGIRQLSIEEDSCREVADIGHDRIYLTDRLGTPLIETVTEPDMHTPEEAAEVGQLLRRLARSTGHVRTGYGAGRQDVNVSVTGGTRIEIKGTPQIWRNPHLIYNEARRQWSLLQIRAELHRRGIDDKTLNYTFDDVTRLVQGTEYDPLRAALAEGHRVRAIVLRGFGGLLREQTQEHTNFAREFSDRVRVIACLTKLPNLCHSDAASDSLSGRAWKDIRHRLHAQHNDAVLVVWGSERDTIMACQEIALRAREATLGVPSDTRQAHKDGTNGFERVLPGAERMYPDTDLPPLEIEEARIARLQAGLPEYVWEREARYAQLGVPTVVIHELAVSRWAALFDRVVRELHAAPRLAAIVLTQRLKALRRSGHDVGRLTEQDLYDVFAAHAAGRLGGWGMVCVLRRLTAPRHVDAAAPSAATWLQDAAGTAVSDNELAQAITRALGETPAHPFASEAQCIRYATGRVLKALAARVDGAAVVAAVTKAVRARRLATRAGDRPAAGAVAE